MAAFPCAAPGLWVPGARACRYEGFLLYHGAVCCVGGCLAADYQPRGDCLRYDRGAHLFRKLGLKTGDGIAIFMENNVHYLPICWAAQRSGLYYTCISSRLTAGEIEYIVKDCGAKIFITSISFNLLADGLRSAMEIKQ